MSKSESREQLSSPQPKRSQSRGVKRARELLDIATELFISKGIEETTIDDIVAHAGTAKGTFYHHYSSKADLLLAIKKSHREDFDSYIERELEKQTSDPIVRLEAWVRAICEAYALMVNRQDIAFSGAGFRWTPRDMKHMEDLVALLQQGNKQSTWHVKDVYKVAIFIEKGVIGVMDDLILTNRSLKNAHRSVIEMVRHIVGL